jgi:hypothetical protein
LLRVPLLKTPHIHHRLFSVLYCIIIDRFRIAADMHISKYAKTYDLEITISNSLNTSLHVLYLGYYRIRFSETMDEEQDMVLTCNIVSTSRRKKQWE